MRLTLTGLAVLFHQIIFSQAPKDFYGTNPSSALYGMGEIFKVRNDSIEVFPMKIYGEKFPLNSTPIEAAPGLLYGTTSSGGANNQGVIYEYNILTDAYRIRFSFDSIGSGKNPSGTMLKGSNGKLYGMTRQGGVNGFGVIYEFDISTFEVVKLFDFDGQTGKTPVAELIESVDGNFYGMTSAGGANGLGTIFRYLPSTNTVENLYNFSSTNGDGYGVNGGFCEASNGMLYGMTTYGGTSNYGVIFEFDRSSLNYSKIRNLDYNSRFPDGSLIETSNGLLCGITKGSLIFYDAAIDSLQKIITGGSGTPYEDSSGEIFWLSKTLVDIGSSVQTGGICHYDGGAASVLAYFSSDSYNPSSNFIAGYKPSNSLFKASDGMFYGHSELGSSTFSGAIFKYDGFSTSIGAAVVFKTQSPIGTTSSQLVEVNQNLFGLGNGGIYNNGTIFKLDMTSDSIIVVADLDYYDNNNSAPTLLTSLILHPNGKLYAGVPGGQNSSGYILEFNPLDNTIENRFDFPPLPWGVQFSSNITVAPNGNLYGVLAYGGLYEQGVLYSFDPVSGVFQVEHDFSDTVLYAYRLSPTVFSDSVLIGITPGYSANSENPILYSYNINSSAYSVLTEFSQNIKPKASPVVGPDGKIYQLFLWGQNTNAGEIVSYDPGTSITSITYTFQTSPPGVNQGEFIFGSDGYIHGRSGYYSDAYWYRLDPATGTMTYQWQDVSFFGSGFGRVTEVCRSFSESSVIDSSEVCKGNLFSYSSGASGDSLNYQWYKSGSALQGQLSAQLEIVNVQLSDSGWYFCLVSNGCREIFSDSVYLTVNPLPQVDAGTDLQICYDSLVTLYSTGNAVSYTWSGGIFDSVAFIVSGNGQYILTGVNEFGCTSSDTVGILITPQVYAGQDTLVCYLTPATLNASGNAISYVWNDTIADGSSTLISESGYYIVTGVNAIGCSYSDTLQILVDTCLVVWPGDTDNDWWVSANDFLNLGLNYGQTGPSRAVISDQWQPFPADYWDSTMITTGNSDSLNMAYADCNGDGIVDISDTIAVYNNFGMLHVGKQPGQQSPSENNTTSGIYFSSPSQQYGSNQLVAVDIYAGSVDSALNNIAGLAFDLNYSVDNIVPSSVIFGILDQTWMGEIGSTAIRLGVPTGANSATLAISRVDHTNISGYGLIGRLSFVTSSQEGTITISADNAFSIDNTGEQQTLEANTLSITVDPSLSLIEMNPKKAVVFPNPSHGHVQISYLDPANSYNIIVRDVNGKILNKTTVRQQSKTVLDVEASSGVYWIELNDGTTIQRERLIINK